MDTANMVRQAQREIMQEFGEQFERNRNGEVVAFPGRRNAAQHTFIFLNDADISVGDMIRSITTGELYPIVDVDRHVIANQVVSIAAKYETPNQQAQRLAAAEASASVMTIGTIQNSIVNLTSQLTNVTQTITALPNSSQTEKDTLVALMQQLSAALRDVPITHTEEAETVSERAEALAKEARKAKPDHGFLTVSADGLKKAAANLAAVLPAVVPIATQLADQFLKAAQR